VAHRRKPLDLRAVAAALTDSAHEHAGMDVIARTLGVAKPTLYRMAGSREALIRLVVDAEGERLLDAIHRHGLHGVFRFAEESPAGFTLLFAGRYPEARPVVRRVENRLRDRIAASEVVAAGLLGLAAGLTRRAIEEETPLTSERLSSAFDAVVKIAGGSSDQASVRPPAQRA
jgi:AcrR family transcriptional regulator